MIYPKILKMHDKIGVTATSDGCKEKEDQEKLQVALEHIAQLGYDNVVTKNCYTSTKGRSSDAHVRKNELMSLISDDTIKAIFAPGGGDYLLEMLSHLDFEEIKKNPKWFQGYSDLTGLLFTITTNCDMATIYASNAKEFAMKGWHPSLIDNWSILRGENVLQKSFDLFQDGFVKNPAIDAPYECTKQSNWKMKKVIDGVYQNTQEAFSCKGRLIGGCLDVIVSLIGTNYDKTFDYLEKYKADKYIWYLETFDLTAEKIILALWQMREAGWFAHTSAIVWGRPLFFSTSTETSYEEAIVTGLEKMGIPIIYDVDFGHKPPRMTIVNGAVGQFHYQYNKDTQCGEGMLEMEFI